MAGGAKIIKFPGDPQKARSDERTGGEDSPNVDDDASAVTPIPKPKKRPKKKASGLSSRRKAGPGKPPDAARARARKRDRALREIERIQAKAGAKGIAALSDWEREFLESLQERLGEYDAAFRDPNKGVSADALSFRQNAKLREVKKKSAKDPARRD